MTAREELAREALIVIIRDYGRMLGEDARRCEALLKDFCPDGRAQVHLLVIAARAGVPKQLMSSAAGSSRELLVARLARTLEEDYAVTAEAARWAVECWALALGVAVAVARPTAPIAVVAQPPPGAPIAATVRPRPLRRKWPAGQRFVDNGDGTVTDAKTGLIWADSDNGSHINWKDAKKYCAGKGDGWELPTVAQLQGLVDASGKYTQQFEAYTCNVTSLIRLSGFFFWSSEANGSSMAWTANLSNGSRTSTPVGFPLARRALCVRRSQVAAVEPSRPLRRKWPAGQRFVDNGDGTVTDAKTGLIWADSDNGSGINWKDAKKYCVGKGGGWELPTVAQLQELHDASGKYTQEVSGLICRVTPLIRLSGVWYWSSEANGSSDAWYVVLTIGTRSSKSVDYASYARALCVRRS